MMLCVVAFPHNRAANRLERPKLRCGTCQEVQESASVGVGWYGCTALNPAAAQGECATTWATTTHDACGMARRATDNDIEPPTDPADKAQFVANCKALGLCPNLRQLHLEGTTYLCVCVSCLVCGANGAAPPFCGCSTFAPPFLIFQLRPPLPRPQAMPSVTMVLPPS